MSKLFGYVRVCKPELKVKEYEMYKAVYCSLCKHLGKKYGILSRLTLSYDFTFLALINMSLKDECEEFYKGRCAFNPIKKCNYCKSVASLDMPAAAAMIMLYYKLLDNIDDEKGIKKVLYLALRGIYSKAHKKAAKEYPDIENIFLDYIKEQKLLEAENCESADRAADPTAKALSKVFEFCSDDETEKRILSRMGYCIGRYIYLLDAACDLEEDVEKGNYNPLKTYAEDKDYKKNVIVPQLYIAASETAKAFELLDVKKMKNILDNIIYLGLEETFKKELNYEGSL